MIHQNDQQLAGCLAKLRSQTENNFSFDVNFEMVKRIKFLNNLLTHLLFIDV